MFIHEPSAAERALLGRADDATIAFGPTRGQAASPAGATTTTRPAVRMRLTDTVSERRHAFIEVRTKDGDRVVTVIEFLSPANKVGAGREQYLAKRRRLAEAGVNLLQVDLLRGGGRRLLPADGPPHDYAAMLIRRDAPDADVWLWSVRDPLPVLPVPLDEGDGDVPLDLQRAFAFAYDANGYGASLYARPPEPPLSDDDAAWAAGLLKEAGVSSPHAGQA